MRGVDLDPICAELTYGRSGCARPADVIPSMTSCGRDPKAGMKLWDVGTDTAVLVYNSRQRLRLHGPFRALRSRV